MAPATKALHEAVLRALKMVVRAYETWIKHMSNSSGEGRQPRDARKITALS